MQQLTVLTALAIWIWEQAAKSAQTIELTAHVLVHLLQQLMIAVDNPLSQTWQCILQLNALCLEPPVYAVEPLRYMYPLQKAHLHHCASSAAECAAIAAAAADAGSQLAS